MKIRVEKTGDPRWCAVRLYLDEASQHVSGLWLGDYQMRVGSAVLRMAGVGGVGTREEHRKKGYARRVIMHALKYMNEAGYDVSMLFGIQHFYPKFGYVATPFNYRVELNPDTAVYAHPTLRTRPWEERDLPVILDIYQQNNASRTGTIVRPKHWPGFSKGSSFHARPVPYVVVNERNQVVGYWVWDETEEHTTVSEVGASHPEVWDTLIHHFGKRAQRLGHDSIQILTPPDHPLTLRCKRYGCRVVIHWPADGGGMMRLINLESTFRKLLPELSTRWKRAGISAGGDLSLHTTIGRITLRLSNQGVALIGNSPTALTVSIPQESLTQMIMGYRTASEVCLDKDVHIPEAVRPWLDALFPATYPYIWWSDRF